MIVYWDDFIEVKDLEEFIEKVKDNSNFNSAINLFFPRKIKELTKETYKIELKSKNLEEIIKELKTHQLELKDILSETECFEYILDNAYGIFQVEYDEYKDAFIIKKGKLDFHPSLFDNIAFLYYETKEDLDHLLENVLNKKPLDYKKWKKFKDYFETIDMPDELYSEIRTFIEKVLETMEEDENA